MNPLTQAREALQLIADTDPIDAMLDPQRAVRVAREALAAIDAALSADPAVPAEPVACVTECEACFTPDVCQLRGTCDHYSAEKLRVAKLAAAPKPAEPVQQWQPVETAPEATFVLACNALGYVGRAVRVQGHWQHIGRPTHWMLLPVAPKPADAQE